MSSDPRNPPDRPAPGKTPSPASVWGVYLRGPVLIVLLLGFSAGLPLALSGATLTVWLADRGVGLGSIGLLSLAGLPYTFKFLWAPLVDAVDVPVLSRLLGRRRAWMLASQTALLGAIVFLGTRDPLAAPLMIGLGAVLVAAASATQDIVIDAYRVESLEVDEQAAGMASYVAAYRIGMLVSGAGVVGLTAWLEAEGFAKTTTWPIAYAVCALFVAVGMLAVLAGREPAMAPAVAAPEAVNAEGLGEARNGVFARVWRAAKGAFGEFLSQDAAIAVLIFVILYKLCDALAGAMTGPFVLAGLGYDKATYAGIVKGVGLAALLLGGFAGGFVARALTLTQSLWLGAILQMLSNGVFIWLGWQDKSAWALTVAIVIENFAGAIGTVIFVAYLSALCRNPLHTATQYALLTAMASTGRTFLSSGTGFAAQAIGWPLFFLGTIVAAVPSLILLAWLQRRGHFKPLGSGQIQAGEMS
jgi:MFS transporter, PAT family, beta-lactamase induction signal transducer AmpG